MDIARVLLLLIQMGTVPTFPEGNATLQKFLADKIVVTCSTVDGELGKKYTDTLHIIKNHPKFKLTKKSYFLRIHLEDIYS